MSELADRTPPVDFMLAPRTRVHVYRCPQRLSNGYCFGTGRPIVFLNVDWFDAMISDGRADLIEFIKGKRYFDPSATFLVLGDHPDFTFTIAPPQPGDPVP